MFFSFSVSVYDVSNPMAGLAALFSESCEGEQCVRKAEIAIGSSAIDYESDSENPIFHRMVLFGGRGWSILEVPEDPESNLKLVFDSGDDAERIICERIPWAYNAQVDEEMAPGPGMANNTYWFHSKRHKDDIEEKNDPEIDGCADQGDGTPGPCPMGSTIDSESDDKGPDFKHIAVGVACGRLVAVTATESSSTAWLYDITDITSRKFSVSLSLAKQQQYNVF